MNLRKAKDFTWNTVRSRPLACGTVPDDDLNFVTGEPRFTHAEVHRPTVEEGSSWIASIRPLPLLSSSDEDIRHVVDVAGISIADAIPHCFGAEAFSLF